MSTHCGTYVLPVLLIVLLLGCPTLSFDPQPFLQFSIQQTLRTLQQLQTQGVVGTQFPSNSLVQDGKTIWATTVGSGWTSGFLSGTLWRLYNHTKDETLHGYALNITEGLKSEQHNTGTHDVGFIIFYSFGYGYLVNNDSEYLNVVLTAAKSLSTRYNPVVGCIRSWNGPHFQVIIDNMMNLELLWWAAKNGGSKQYADMAESHSDHMIRDCIKEDGSSYHLIDYDPDTGAVLSQSNTPQGYPGGVWSRGEGWALYGFVKSYIYSGRKRYLDTANLVASYLIPRLPSDFVPYWDFDHPTSLSQRDTSAASIIASALLDLSTLVDSPLSQKYVATATQILTSLGTPAYRADPATSDVILLHGCIGYELEPDVALIYGDYYLVEALLKYTSIVGKEL